MGLMSKILPALSKPRVKDRNNGSDAIFAALRRLEQRVSGLEQTSSILKRDVARIDRKQYREVPTPAPSILNTYDPWRDLG